MAFRDGLLASLSRPLAKKVLTSLKGILSEAQDRGLVAVNVASRVTVGVQRGESEKAKIPDIGEVKAILAKLDEFAADPKASKAKAWRRWRALLATAIHTGMRASEIRGVPWDAIDVDAGTIEVCQRADEVGRIGPPKSPSSCRKINIPTSLVRLLREWKIEAPKGPLAFGNSKGNAESLANIFNRAWKPVQIAAGVADLKTDAAGDIVRDRDGRPVMRLRYNFHMLRHFRASMLIADDANPKEVQAEMGHSSIQITYDLYGHRFHDEEADRRRQERSERLAGLLS